VLGTLIANIVFGEINLSYAVLVLVPAQYLSDLFGPVHPEFLLKSS
jgi:hypothetical protein